ncbi:hypothetical protein DLJ53_32800 [Acuticoccus sediminis]|uniref:Uncharacterized protein n=1 Tax=Acuticoccus sediminis TaxID=2184697 RepID=A0A8B2NLY2_9HYPH|nr:hypothetical protein DLJ53_32800 [Acuticoccus sediminis]
MAERKRHAQALTDGASAVGASHLRVRPCLVDENQPLGLELVLAVEPDTPAGEDVRTVLLGRMAGLFCA